MPVAVVKSSLSGALKFNGKDPIQVEAENYHIIHPQVCEAGLLRCRSFASGQVFRGVDGPRHVVDCPELCGGS